MTSKLTKAGDAYNSFAVIICNTLIALLLINLALWAVFAWRDREPDYLPQSLEKSPDGYFYEQGGAVDNGKRTPSNLSIFDYKAYEGVLSEREISDLLDEYYDHAKQGYDYWAYSQYSHRPFAGQYLNVDLLDNGFTTRRTINPAQASDAKDTFEIFVFGGSTTFGLGVGDADTVPSQLSKVLNERAEVLGKELNIKVTNFGRVGFYPTQELHLLMELLRAGERPDLVIFLDGLNHGRDDDTPSLTSDYIRTLNAAQVGDDAQTWKWIPMVRAAQAVQYRIAPEREQAEPKALIRNTPEQVVERFLQMRTNVKALADIYEFDTLFFLQPDAHYNYPEQLFAPGRMPIRPKVREFKRSYYAAFPNDAGFIDLTGLFAQWGPRKAIVDTGHYSPNFSVFVAQRMAKEIDVSALAVRSRAQAAPTGIARER